MEVRFLPDKASFKNLTTSELRKNFLIDNLFLTNQISIVYSDIDRSIIGSAMPISKAIKLNASKTEMAVDYFLERREIGIFNIGGKGIVSVDKVKYKIDQFAALYVGMGVKDVTFQSEYSQKPAMYYFVSYPAHKSYPTKYINMKNTELVHLGSQVDSNKRTVYKYILPGKVESCQLVMGLTVLNEGSVWNTIPPHAHLRRSEIYLYFNLSKNSFVVHLLGEPKETRHIIIRNKQAIISPSWSLHAGAGTQNYAFVWAMGGENQTFDDMDWISMNSLQ